jgi:hypothetical protein
MPSIPINNSGFESQDLSSVPDFFTFGTGSGFVDGWVIEDGRGGAYQIQTGEIGNLAGANVAYLYDTGAKLKQTLTYQYNANEQITLSLRIGDPNYTTTPDGAQAYTIRILAGTNEVGRLDGNTGNNNELEEVTVFSTVTNPTFDGQLVTIEIEKTGPNSVEGELHIDAVAASYTVLGPDGIVDGTENSDVMGVGYSDSGGDTVDNLGNTISAGDGSDVVVAGTGDDIIDGGAGNDNLAGGEGDDTFLAGEGVDLIAGGLGANTYDASGDAQGNYTPELQNEAIEVSVGVNSQLGSSAYGDGTVAKSNSNTTDNISDIQNFVAGEDQDGGANGGGSGLRPGSPNLPNANPPTTSYTDVDLVGTQFDVSTLPGRKDGNDGIQEVIFAQDGGPLSVFKFKFAGKNGSANGGDDEQDFLVFDLNTFDDDFTLNIASENGTSRSDPDKVIFTNATSVVENDNEFIIRYTGSDGQIHKVTVNPDNADVEVYGNQTDAIDEITLQGDVLVSEIDIDNAADAIGVFTNTNGDQTNFGGTNSTKLTDILANPQDAVGDYEITDGVEDGEIGGIDFENFETIYFSVACFTRGTMIETSEGEIAIENLSAGTKIFTRDNGFQHLRWIGTKTVAARGKMAPILFKEGAIGNRRPLLVSPQHRMFISGPRAELLFGEPEVLVAAKMLVNEEDIVVCEGGKVEYYHMLFDNHEIVLANGMLSESFHPGLEGFGAFAEEAREEILALFPELESDGLGSYGQTARRVLKAYEANLMVGAF